MMEHNADVPMTGASSSASGINLGDVIVDDQDLFGDAVISPRASKPWPSRAASASRDGARGRGWQLDLLSEMRRAELKNIARRSASTRSPGPRAAQQTRRNECRACRSWCCPSTI